MNDLSKDAVNRLAVDEAGAGQRVDNFLLRVLKGVPKSHIYRILRSGEVRVNRLRVKPDVRLVLGDELRIPPIRTGLPTAGSASRRRFRRRSPILYEDDALIAVDKPAGLAVHGGSGVSFGLIEQMRAARPTAKFLELVHRLDRDTSEFCWWPKSGPLWSGYTRRFARARRQALPDPGQGPLARREAGGDAAADQVSYQHRRAPRAGRAGRRAERENGVLWPPGTGPTSIRP